MARIRYLKPEFFSDEDLCELAFETRLAFAGLWCYADKAGRLEDRPKFLKAMIFPYDNIDMEEQLQTLCQKPFLVRYEIDGRRFIQIVNWDKHQKPHHTEPESKIPPAPLLIEKGKGKEKGTINIKGRGKRHDQQPPLKNGEETVKEPLGNDKPTVKEPLNDEKKEKVPPLITPEKIMSLFNETTRYLPKVTELGESRRNKVKRRIKEGKSDLEWWRVVFEKADMILIPGRNGKKDWFPTFDWLMENDKNALKVFEGNYDDAKRPLGSHFMRPQPGIEAFLRKNMEGGNDA